MSNIRVLLAADATRDVLGMSCYFEPSKEGSRRRRLLVMAAQRRRLNDAGAASKDQNSVANCKEIAPCHLAGHTKALMIIFSEPP